MPGAGSIYTISTGLFRGWRSSIAAAFGCTAGIIPHLLFSILVLSSVYEYSTEAFQAIKYIGAVYLLYLAYSMWKESGRSEISENSGKRNLNSPNLEALIIFILGEPALVPGSSCNT